MSGVWGLEFRARPLPHARGSGFRVWGVGTGGWDYGFRLWGLEFGDLVHRGFRFSGFTEAAFSCEISRLAFSFSSRRCWFTACAHLHVTPYGACEIDEGDGQQGTGNSPPLCRRQWAAGNGDLSLSPHSVGGGAASQPPPWR